MAPLLCTSFPTLPFHQNLIASQVSCTNCDYRGNVNIQPEACLTIFLNHRESTRLVPNHSRSSKSDKPVPPVYLPSLNDYLASQSATTEPLPDLPCPKCHTTLDTSNRSSKPIHSTCQRQQWIAHIPNYLVLYVQRTDWLNLAGSGSASNPWSTQLDQTGNSNSAAVPTRVTQIGTKRSEHMNFPAHLDVSNYLLSSKLTGNLQQKRFDESGDNRLSCSSFGQESVEPHSKPQQSRPYILRSVLVHQGRYLQSGHYITYRYWPLNQTSADSQTSLTLRLASSLCTYISNYFKGIPTRSTSPTSSEWLLTSDLHILRVPAKEVHSSMAYLLFYERLPDPDLMSSSQSLELDRAQVRNTNVRFAPNPLDLLPNQEFADNFQNSINMACFGKRQKADLIRHYMLNSVS